MEVLLTSSNDFDIQLHDKHLDLYSISRFLKNKKQSINK